MATFFTKIEHVIDAQFNAEQAFLAEYEAGTFTIDNPFVKLNPYLVAPLTALVMFETEKPAFAKVTVKGKEAGGDIMYRPTTDSKKMVLPILGLYPDYDNTVVIELSTGETKTLTITTEPAGEKLKKPTMIETTAEYMDGNVMFVSPTSPAYTAAYDYAGDARWYTPLNLAFDIKRARNGRLLIGTDRLLMPPYHTTGIYELGTIGKIYKEFRLPGGYHHDQFEMENGNLLILSQIPPRGTVEDYCVLVDRNTGEILKTWDHQDVLPQFPVGGSGSQDGHDWFHNNAVWYDKKTNSLSFSGRHQDIIINRDFETSSRVEQWSWATVISNGHDKAVSLRVEEAAPIARDAEVKIRVSTSPKARLESEKSRYVWELSLPAREKAEVRYEVKAVIPEKAWKKQ